MALVPEHLAKNACNISAKPGEVSFGVRCTCGCDTFYMYENYLSVEEKAELERYGKELVKVLKPGRKYTVTKDPDGAVHHWRICWPFGKKKEVFPPKAPDFDELNVLKAECSVCGEMILLFDSRLHGYDAVTCSEYRSADYVPQFKRKKKTAVRLEIRLENDLSFENFQECAGKKFTADEYSEAFASITIVSVDENGKRGKVYEAETA